MCVIAYRRTFQRAYDKAWTKEVFLVTDRMLQQAIPLYSIKSYNNEPILGKFYQNELEKVYNELESTVYKIEKYVKKQTKNKKKGYIVKWVGWGSEFNSWVAEKEIKDIKKKE